MYALISAAASFAATDIGGVMKRMKLSAALLAVAFILFMTAYCFALIAAYNALAVSAGTTAAALTICAGAVGLAGLTLAGLAIANRIERRRRDQRMAARRVQAAMAVSALPLLLRSKSMAIAATTIVGVLAYFMISRDGSSDPPDEA